VKAALKNSES